MDEAGGGLGFSMGDTGEIKGDLAAAAVGVEAAAAMSRPVGGVAAGLDNRLLPPPPPSNSLLSKALLSV